MRRVGWTAVAGFGVAGLFLASPAWGSHHEKAEGKASEQGSEARGSGQAGVSTGARPGEVTGSSEPSGGTSAKEEAAAAAASQEVSGTVEKYDREKRTLSLKGSDKKLKITDDTQVMKDGDRISPGQILEGDEIRASFSGGGDEVEVALIEVTGSTPGGAAPPGSSEPSSGGSPKDTAAGTKNEPAPSTDTK